MSAKIMKISVLGVLVVAGLGVGYGASIFLSDSDSASSDPIVAGEQSSDALAQKKVIELPPELSEFATLKPKNSPVNELVTELRHNIGEYKKRLTELDKRERNVAMAEAAIRDDAEKLENLWMKLDMPLMQLNDAIKVLRDTRILIDTQEKVEIKKTAAIYEKMDATSSSQILVEMCTNSEEDAVKILYYMSERSAAKCLAEMSVSNTPLAAKLSQRIKVINEEG